jgi:hypothetical protein
MSFWDKVSEFLGTDRSDSFIGHVGEVLAHDNIASAAATAVAAYFGLPYVPGGSELAAYASEMASAAPTAVGAGGITAGAALAEAGATAADLGTVASGTAAGTAATGAGALTPAALESAAGTAGYGVNAAAQAAGQIGQAGAYTGAIGNLANNFMLASLLNPSNTGNYVAPPGGYGSTLGSLNLG